jgi:hypothetical protein
MTTALIINLILSSAVFVTIVGLLTRAIIRDQPRYVTIPVKAPARPAMLLPVRH